MSAAFIYIKQFKPTYNTAVQILINHIFTRSQRRLIIQLESQDQYSKVEIWAQAYLVPKPMGFPLLPIRLENFSLYVYACECVSLSLLLL